MQNCSIQKPNGRCRKILYRSIKIFPHKNDYFNGKVDNNFALYEFKKVYLVNPRNDNKK